jgi:16S rRNA (adenine1518-N6/adenine1519-N6)-dimethyltransferase
MDTSDSHLASPSRVRAILQGMELSPSRVLGQNFLIDRNILNILLDAASLHEGDSVLEIGPGLGIVTVELLARGCRVLAIEKDRRLADRLSSELGGDRRFEVRCGDVMDADMAAIGREGFSKVVSNLPYAVASRVLVEMAMADPAPQGVTVTVQKEVASRLTAQAGTGAYGLLTLWIQRMYSVRLVKTVSPTCFWPAPEVQSGIVHLSRRPAPLVAEPAAVACFHAASRYAFSRRRKQLASSLAEAVEAPARSKADWQESLAALGVPPLARPEDLSPEDWARLALGPLAGARVATPAGQ